MLIKIILFITCNVIHSAAGLRIYLEGQAPTLTTFTFGGAKTESKAEQLLTLQGILEVWPVSRKYDPAVANVIQLYKLCSNEEGQDKKFRFALFLNEEMEKKEASACFIKLYPEANLKITFNLEKTTPIAYGIRTSGRFIEDQSRDTKSRRLLFYIYVPNDPSFHLTWSLFFSSKPPKPTLYFGVPIFERPLIDFDHLLGSVVFSLRTEDRKDISYEGFSTLFRESFPRNSPSESWNLLDLQINFRFDLPKKPWLTINELQVGTIPKLDKCLRELLNSWRCYRMIELIEHFKGGKESATLTDFMLKVKEALHQFGIEVYEYGTVRNGHSSIQEEIKNVKQI